MKLSGALNRKIAGVPGWAWAATLLIMVAWTIYRRRQAGEAALEGEEPAEEEYAGTPPPSWPGGVIGGDGGSYDFLDAIENLGNLVRGETDTVLDRIDETEDNLTTVIGDQGEQLGAIIQDGYNTEPAPTIPPVSGAPGGGAGGGGNGQLPPTTRERIARRRNEITRERTQVAAKQAKIAAIRSKPGKLTAKQKKRVGNLRTGIKQDRRVIKKKKNRIDRIKAGA